MSRIRSHLNYSNVMVTILAFIVLGGSAYAAFHLPRNSVRSKNIVNGQVKSADVKDNGLTGKDVKDLSYTDLTLKNNWGDAGADGYTPAAAIDAQGIVHLRGAIAQGIASTDNFTQLPPQFRPDKTVYVAVDMTNAHPGRIYITLDGEAHAVGQPQSNAQLFTSLDGVTYDAGG